MGMEVQLAIVTTSSILVSICCIVWLAREFASWVQRMVGRLVKELEKIEQ